MSLCVALNNPYNFVVIAGDGRISKGGVIVRDDHKKLTMLTEHISIFTSGCQDYCEELRSMVTVQVNEHTSIEEVAKTVQKASIEVKETLILPSHFTRKSWMKTLGCYRRL